jgi:DNA mismatch endonuclease (patch repair protein)
VERDGEVVSSLHDVGWRVATVWECGLRGCNSDLIVERVVDWVRRGVEDFDSGVVRPYRGSISRKRTV